MGAKPTLPKPQEVVRMPLPDDERAREAKRAAQNRLMTARGRDSTNLAPDTDKLGY